VFGELPKIFDRNFVIAFFLPALVFVAANLGLFVAFDLFSPLISFMRSELLQGASTLGIMSWTLGVLLLVLNYNIYRTLEGYGKYNPLQFLKKYEINRFNRLQGSLTKLRRQIQDGDASGEEEVVLNELRAQRDKLLRTKVQEFPLDARRLLPTKFGNVLRSFEDYPPDIYGVDSIIVWVRLLAVITKDYRELLDSAKAQTDFWTNLWLLGGVFIIEYVGLVLYTAQPKRFWIPLVAVLLSWRASSAARAAAIQWGDYVKSCFDLFLPQLHRKLHLPQTTNIADERELWMRFSQIVIYHRADKVFDRTLVAKPDDAEGENSGGLAAKD